MGTIKRTRPRGYASDVDDVQTRREVAYGGEKTVSYLDKYGDKLGKVVLELGPYFNPAILPADFRGLIIYVEINKAALGISKRTSGSPPKS